MQVDAAGELAPDRLTETGRRELKNLLRTYDQELTALNCPFRRGLDVAENQQPRLEYVRQVMSLAFELGPRMVIAPVPETARRGRGGAGQPAPRGPDSTSAGTGTGWARSWRWRSAWTRRRRSRAYLDTFDVGSLKVNYDPANLLVNGFDPVTGIIPLHRRIAHTHARDARRSTVSRGRRRCPRGRGHRLAELRRRRWRRSSTAAG